MTSDQSIMEEMLERATNPGKDVDELSIQMFCIIVKSNQSLIHKAQELIVDKIKSYNIPTAIKAISLLEECMTKCGSEFQDESAKFRFLNELIRLVSKKYQGAETPNDIKQRIMDCLLLWTTEFPKKLKIRDAYEMLCKEGVAEKNEGSSATAAKRESVLGIDGEMLTKLLNSRNPEDLKRANLHIQHRVNQEARRTELIIQQKSELQEVQTTISLLNQMLDTYSDHDSDVNETIQTLYKNCKKHKPILKRMPELLEGSNEELLAETLEANDLLEDVINRYKKTIQSTTNNVIPDSSPKENKSGGVALLTDLLNSSEEVTPMRGSDFHSNSTLTTAIDNLEELSNIFNTATKAADNLKIENFTPTSTNNLFNYSNVLQPSKISEKCEESVVDRSDKVMKRGHRGLSEIDKLSEDLIKQNLSNNEIVGQFVKDSKKPTLNELAKEIPIHQLNLYPEPIDNMLGLGDEEIQSGEHTPNTLFPVESKKTIEQITSVTHLSDIKIDIDEIIPCSEERVLLDDTELQLKIVFSVNRPMKNVSVIVITVNNKCNLHIKDFQIEASVKKPCKVRLLPATNTNLLPHKPFRSSTPINQILLLYNATGVNVDVTLLVGYVLGDDPDPIKESIIANDIPFVE